MAANEDVTLAFVPQLDPDGTPYVHAVWGEQIGAFTPTAARRAALALLEAAEQADLEHSMWEWLLQDSETSADPKPIEERRAGVARILSTFRHHREQPAPFAPTEET